MNFLKRMGGCAQNAEVDVATEGLRLRLDIMMRSHHDIQDQRNQL